MANLVDERGTTPVDRVVRLLESVVPTATTMGTASEAASAAVMPSDPDAPTPANVG
jgi:hypothetical protein